MTDQKRPDDSAPLTSVRAVVDRLKDAASDRETSLADMLECLGRASFTPMLLAPALAVVTPLSGIPLLSSACGILIALIGVQLLIGRDHLWLPGWLTRRQVPSDRLRSAAEWLETPADWIDRHTGKRLKWLTTPPMDRLIYLSCALCGAAMPMLELVPFTSSILAAAVALMSITLLVRDGLLALAGWAVIAAAVTTVIVLV